MRSFLLAAAGVATTLLLGPATAAGAGSHVPGLGPAKRLASGGYEVQLRTGPPVRTHGVDGPETSDPLATFGSRPPACAPDNHQRILYGRPASAPDRLEEARPAIRAAIWGMNAALDAAAVASGGRHADYRVRCDGQGELLVGTFVNHRSSSLADVIDAARAAGATDRTADYTIFYDDATPEVCGAATLYPDDRLSIHNANNRGGGYSVAYSDCWDAATLMHETAHAQGAVQPTSPHSTGDGGHCRDEVDVMCYSDGGSRDIGIALRCEGGSRFDCGDDDYFDAAPEPGEWLESHWNLGSPLNLFIDFGDLKPGEDAGAHSELTRVICEVAGLLPLGTGGGHSCAPAGEPDLARAVAAAGDRVVLRSARLRGRGVRIRVICPAGRTVRCVGRLRLTDGRGRTLGRRAFSTGPGRAADVQVAVSRRVRRRWARARRAPRVRVATTESGAARRTWRTLVLVR